jgi:hypothetical protein
MSRVRRQRRNRVRYFRHPDESGAGLARKGLKNDQTGLSQLLAANPTSLVPSARLGYRRIKLASGKKSRGEYRCLLCDHLLEVFDGSSEEAIRLTVEPEKIMNDGDNRFFKPK